MGRASLMIDPVDALIQRDPSEARAASLVITTELRDQTFMLSLLRSLSQAHRVDTMCRRNLAMAQIHAYESSLIGSFSFNLAFEEGNTIGGFVRPTAPSLQSQILSAVMTHHG
jgi:hypothetical protein